METYKRLIGFVRPITPFFIAYLTFSLLHAFFSVMNFAFLAPLLNTIFDNIEPETLRGYAETLKTPSFTADYLIAYFNQYLLDTIEAEGKIGALKFICFLVILSVVLANLFRYLQIRLLVSNMAKMAVNVRKTLFDKVLLLSTGYFNEQKKGDIISRNTNDTNMVESTLVGSMGLFIKEPILIVFYFTYLFNSSLQLTLFALVVIPISGGLISVLVKKLKKHATGLQQLQSDLLTMLDETIGGMKVIKAFNATNYMRNQYAEQNTSYGRMLRQFNFRRELASPFSETTGVIIAAALLYYGGQLILSGDGGGLDGGGFIAYLAIFSQVTRPIKAISVEYGNLQRGLSAGKRIFELLDTPEPIQNSPNAQSLEGFNEKLELKNITFSYEPDRKILENINLEIPKGKTIALVGPSGGGKSTLADLIPRFYDVDAGEIMIDGINIKQVKQEDLHRQFGIVTQESILFNDSIFNNIAFGLPNASMEEVIQAAQVANAHEFIMATENGYDTVIGDRGAKLSGGQRQRLSIARAVFKNPPILILDEATSALDTESEKLVQDALTHLMANRTSIVIAHRLSTIQNADEILVIGEGKIMERGTHEALLQNENGVYRKLTEMQAIGQ